VPDLSHEERDALAYLRSPRAIRERCQYVLELADHNQLPHFVYAAKKLHEVVEYVVTVMRHTYPHLDIPWHSRWRHFNAGGVDRLAILRQRLAALDQAERTRCCVDLVVTSVLLDAGAGTQWHYHEAASGTDYTRSEGLAVASFHMFFNGLFSSRGNRPWQVDTEGLQGLTETSLAEAMQVTAHNPLVGLAGRAALLRQLGVVLERAPHYFGKQTPRLGNLYDYLAAHANGGAIHARDILFTILDSLGPIWPGRLTLGGVNLGDVWHHSSVGGSGKTAGLVPFHKLSQWLTYSLIEPLEDAGVRVEGIEALTGLAEYRNGGLLLDLGLLQPRHLDLLSHEHAAGSEVIVEWRALTVALLDRIANGVREMLGLSAHDCPLAKVLEGGTWRAGRQVARERRADGSPPLRIVSDGTVF
jgi:hypothetical protein